MGMSFVSIFSWDTIGSWKDQHLGHRATLGLNGTTHLLEKSVNKKWMSSSAICHHIIIFSDVLPKPLLLDTPIRFNNGLLSFTNLSSFLGLGSSHQNRPKELHRKCWSSSWSPKGATGEIPKPRLLKTTNRGPEERKGIRRIIPLYS